MKKALSIIAVIVIIVFISLFILIKIYVTPERVKKFLIPAAETALNRKVNIGNISISLFKGIEVSNFSIKEADGTTDFLKSKQFVLRYKFLPLLSKKIIIDELRILSPDIRIIRDKNGRFNFETIGKKQTGTVKEEKKETQNTGGALPVSLLVSRLIIDHAEFYFKDEKKDLPEVKGTIDIDADIKGAADGGLRSEGRFDLKLEKVVLKDSPKPIENIAVMLKYAADINLAADTLILKKADLTLQDISASITGDIKSLQTSPQLNIAVSLDKTGAGAIMKLAALFADLKDISLSGAVSSKTNITGKLDALHAEGQLNLNKINVLYKDIPAAIEGDIKFRYSPGTVSVKKADLIIQKIPLSIEGDITDIDKETPKIDAGLSMERIKAETLFAAAKPFIKTEDLSVSGDMKAGLKIRGNPFVIKTLKIDGDIDLVRLGINYRELKTSLNGSLSIKSNHAKINSLNLQIDKTSVSIAGSVMDIMNTPSLDISISVPDTNAAAVQKLAGSFTDLKGISLSGMFGADINLKGRPDKIDTLKAKGSVRLLKMGVTYNKINALFDGSLKINEKTIDIDLSTVCGRNMMQIKGTVDSYMKNQNVKLNLSSKKLALDELLTALRTAADMPSDKTGRGTPQQVPPAAKEPDPVNLTLTADGEIKIDSAVYQGLTIDNLYVTYRFKENRLDLKGTGNAGKGDFDLKALIDLSKIGYSYAVSGKINSLYIEEIINTFLPKAKDTLFGMFTTNFSLNGAGTLPLNLKKNLNADGDFNIKNGKISTVELTRELSRLLNIRELETVEFTKAEGNFHIKNGVASIDSIFQSEKLAMDPKGDIGLIDETLNLAFDLKLSPSLTDKAMGSSISQYIRDKEGWGTVPLLITGTFTKPKYKVEISKVGKKLLENEVNKLLEKLLNKGRDKK